MCGFTAEYTRIVCHSLGAFLVPSDRNSSVYNINTTYRSLRFRMRMSFRSPLSSSSSSLTVDSHLVFTHLSNEWISFSLWLVM